MILGKCEIIGGKFTRNYFEYNEKTRTIYIDYCSDYYFSRDIFVRNPKKALEKARKIVKQFVGKKVTVADLELAGFIHNIPK